jgi:hypothetical protein
MYNMDKILDDFISTVLKDKTGLMDIGLLYDDDHNPYIVVNVTPKYYRRFAKEVPSKFKNINVKIQRVKNSYLLESHV